MVIVTGPTISLASAVSAIILTERVWPTKIKELGRVTEVLSGPARTLLRVD
jgi:hypothetical protein